MNKKIVVVGSGFGGLAAAIRLKLRGHDVTIVEKRDKPGGRAYVYERDGFVFDGGPTVITAPWLITELFEMAGRESREYFELVSLDPFYRIFFHDGSHFDYWREQQRMQTEIAKFSAFASDVDGYARLAQLTERIFAKGFTELAAKPFLSPLDMARVLPELARLQSYRSVYGLVSRYVQDDRLRQVLSFHPLLVGGNPFDTTSIYTLIQHLEREWGVWFAMGGTGAIVNGMVRLFQELGGVLQLNAEATAIATNGNRVTGVEIASGQFLSADVVVCNSDIATTYQRLLPEDGLKSLMSRRLEHMDYGMSLVVIYFGADREYRTEPDRRLSHHNIILGPRYRELLSDIFDRKILADDFSLYLHMPTLTDPSLAPAGGDAFYVLAPVPHLGGGVNWELAAKPLRNRIMEFLEEHYLPDLSQHIVTEFMIDPRHFRDELNSYLGAAFAAEPVLTQSAYFRPHNRSDEYRNLYFVGAGTHPGAGLPGVLSSAQIADDLIAAEDRN